MKKKRMGQSFKTGLCRKWCLIMKLCAFFIVALSFAGFGSSLGQNQIINLNLKDVSYYELFNEINKQTGLRFVYRADQLNEMPSIQVKAKNKKVDEVLKEVFESTGFTYEFNDNIVMLLEKKIVAQQQSFKVQGTITDEKRNPIPGVTIRLEGTTIGTSTDADGNYFLNLPIEKGNLIFSFVGYKQKIQEFRGNQTINIILEEDIEEMEEVVVTGIFTKARESYTGAVTTIKREELQAYRGRNLINTLSNIDPAINIRYNNELGSNPNAIPQINLRGNSSLPTNLDEFNEGISKHLNAPLIIMDGFEISVVDLMDFNDEEIESINILKDAAATAIYGSRGANGVIVIISRQPKPGQLRINAQLSYDLEIPDLSSYNMMNAREKLEYEKMIGLYDTDDLSDQKTLNENYYLRYRNVQEGVDTYWLSKPLRTGLSQNYNIRLDGGSQEFRWGIQAAYKTIAGVMKDSKRDNFNGTITLSYYYKNIIFRNQLKITLNKGYESPYGSFSSYVKMNPYWKIYDEDGVLIKTYPRIGVSSYGTVANPLYNASLNNKNESKYTQITDNFSIEWDIIQNLKMRAQFGVSKKILSSDIFKSNLHTDFESLSGENIFQKGEYKYSTGEDISYDGNITFSYSNTFNNLHQLYAGFDASMGQQESYDYNFVVQGFTNQDMNFLGNALQYEEAGVPSGSESYTRRVGFTGNVNYTFDNRYFIDGSLRYDGSSQFGSNKRFAPFWSTGIGWNLHREHFLESAAWIDNLRLRISYGHTGSQQFTAYQALSTYKYFESERYINWAGTELMGHGNDNLKWQVTKQFNVGTDIGFFQNRLTAQFDVFHKMTSNLLSSIAVTQATGFSSYMENVGEVKNTGFEASLGGYIIRNTADNIMWMVNGKIAHTKNEITKISAAIEAQNEAVLLNDDYDVSNLFIKGNSQYSLYAVRSLGIDPSSGQELFLDKNGNVTDIWKAGDKVYMGINEPKYQGNISTMFMYKNFSINLSFAYHWGGVAYNQTLIDKVEVLYSDVEDNNLDKRVLKDRWSKPGDIAKFKAISNVATRASSRFVMKDNVFQMQTANVQYRWNSKTLKNYGIDLITFSANMKDVFYISSIKRERGTSYPFARSVGASVSIMF